MKKDPRGFHIFSEFTDTYGANVHIKMSSSALKRCWIFVEGGKDKEYAETNQGAIHLNVRQAKLVIAALQKFLKHD